MEREDARYIIVWHEWQHHLGGKSWVAAIHYARTLGEAITFRNVRRAQDNCFACEIAALLD